LETGRDKFVTLAEKMGLSKKEAEKLATQLGLVGTEATKKHEVKVDTDEHIVHLQGIVGSMAERSRAQEVADAVVGTSGRVLNELTVKGVNDTTAGDLDGDIRKNLDKMIDNDPTLKQRDINFDVVNGMVTIKGDVRSVDEKNRVGDMTKAAAGVKDVANGLQIDSTAQ